MPADKSMVDFLGLIASLGSSDGVTMVPEADAADMRSGASYIPYEVTAARRQGKTVTFVQGRPATQWYWKMPDNSKIKYEP